MVRQIFGALTPDLPIRDGFPPHIDSRLLPNKFQNLLADYGGTLPILISKGDDLTVRVTFETKGPPFICKVGVGLNLTTDVRRLRPDVNVAVWLSDTKIIAPSLTWAKQEVILKGKLIFEGEQERDTVDVLKALEVPFRDLDIGGEDMLLADWDRDVYRVGERPLPPIQGLPRLGAYGEGLPPLRDMPPIQGLPRLGAYGEGLPPLRDMPPIQGLPRLGAYGE
jgi:hypothetical protein